MNLSIIIPNYKGNIFLESCLKSLRRQYYCDFEVIIVNNDSRDNSIQFIEFAPKTINWIDMGYNAGFAAAVNTGIRASQGKYVVLLNNDTEVEPGWLEELVHCIEQDEKIFSVSSKMLRFNERNLIDDAGDQYTLMGWAFQRGNGLNQEKFNRDSECFSSCAGAAIYRKKVFEEIGYFDEQYFAYMEDVDIGFRARLFGYRNLYCSSALVYHVGSGTSGSKYNSFKVKLASRNNIYVIVKNMPLVQLLVNLLFLAVGFLIKLLYFWRMGLGQEYWDGLIEGIRGSRNLERVPFSWRRLSNYLSIQWRMNTGLAEYLYQKLLHR